MHWSIYDVYDYQHAFKWAYNKFNLENITLDMYVERCEDIIEEALLNGIVQYKCIIATHCSIQGS